MKKWYLLITGLCVLGLAAPSPAFAGKGNKKSAPQSQPSDVYAKYDKNCNGALEAEEKDAIKKDFEKDKDGPLKAYDTNSDGKLSDEEIAAIPATKPGDTGKTGKKKKNK